VQGAEARINLHPTQRPAPRSAAGARDGSSDNSTDQQLRTRKRKKPSQCLCLYYTAPHCSCKPTANRCRRLVQPPGRGQRFLLYHHRFSCEKMLVAAIANFRVVRSWHIFWPRGRTSTTTSSPIVLFTRHMLHQLTDRPLSFFMCVLAAAVTARSTVRLQYVAG
jgi:hypothetical protein